MLIVEPFLSKPRDALAFEETMFRNPPTDEDIVYVWRSKPAFIVGRNQNPFLEIDHDYAKEQNIPVLRRISGGGTIFFDEGTLNFTHITRDYKNKINDYRYFLKPVIATLDDMGVETSFQPKSHLMTGDRKISGNAQAFADHRLMHHGTLLFDTDLEKIERGLHRAGKIDARGHQVLSDKRTVTNIKAIITGHADTETFTAGFFKRYTAYLDDEHEIWTPPGAFMEDVRELSEGKYRSWAWNYGKTPRFTTHVNMDGERIGLEIDHGIIVGIRPETDRFEGLKGLRFMSEAYTSVIDERKPT